MTNLDKVLKLLSTLTPTERATVMTWLKGYVAIGPSGEQPPPPVDDYLLEGVYTELRRRGLLGMESRLPPADIGAPYQKAVAPVRSLLESKLPKLDNARRAALGVIATRALADYLEARAIPVTRGTLIRAIGSIPDALECSFPGYLNAGLLPFIWSSREERQSVHSRGGNNV